jgi:hypothetical protein
LTPIGSSALYAIITVLEVMMTVLDSFSKISSPRNLLRQPRYRTTPRTDDQRKLEVTLTLAEVIIFERMSWNERELERDYRPILRGYLNTPSNPVPVDISSDGASFVVGVLVTSIDIYFLIS